MGSSNVSPTRPWYVNNSSNLIGEKRSNSRNCSTMVWNWPMSNRLTTQTRTHAKANSAKAQAANSKLPCLM